MVSHDPVAASYADRVVFLADGQIIDEIVRDPGRGPLAAEAIATRMAHLEAGA